MRIRECCALLVVLSNPTKTTVKPLLLVDRGFGDETVSIG
jgi:hypothetical protein